MALEILPQGDGLPAGEHGEHHVMGLVGISALSLPEGGPPAQLVGDEIRYRVRLRGDDEKSLAAVKGLNGSVHQHRFKGQPQQGLEPRLHVEDQQRPGGDGHVADQQGPAHVHAGVLF